MFYTFRQNNAGGRFNSDPIKGIAQYIAVEAPSEEIAVEKFKSLVDLEDQCECCGHRWSTYCEEGDFPSYYEEPLEDLERYSTPFVGAIHHINGEIEIVPGRKS